MSPEDFAARTGVSRETLERLKIHAEMVTRYQRAINLVSRTTLGDIWQRHFLDSARIYPELPRSCHEAEEGQGILDMGSGAGFPGLVLAIMGARNVHLCESDQRKAVFLREVARATGTEITIHSARVEEIPPLDIGVITARALASIDILLDYSEPHRRIGTICLFLKGRTVREELTTARQRWNMAETLIPDWSDSGGCLLRLENISHVESRDTGG